MDPRFREDDEELFMIGLASLQNHSGQQCVFAGMTSGFEVEPGKSRTSVGDASALLATTSFTSASSTPSHFHIELTYVITYAFGFFRSKP